MSSAGNDCGHDLATFKEMGYRQDSMSLCTVCALKTMHRREEKRDGREKMMGRKGEERREEDVTGGGKKVENARGEGERE